MKYSRKIILNKMFVRSIAVLVTALYCTSVTAEVDNPVFTMTTFRDAAYGGKIVAGKYAQAIEKITANGGFADVFFDNTNLCVAYTKSGDVDNAALACDAALEEIRSQRFVRAQEKTYRKYLALALSNRGVVHALIGDIELARQDFVEALGLNAEGSAAEINLARLSEVKAPLA